MNNVSIVSTQFIDCSLQNLDWQNLETSYLNVLNANQTIFSSHQSILISLIVIEEEYFSIINLCFYNLQTGKKIKTLYKQSQAGYEKQSLKLSCLGQVLVFNDETEVISIFWSVQSQKKIRVNRGVRGEGKNQQNQNYIKLWRIYNTQMSQQIQTQGIYGFKFSNNQILILQGNRQSFWDCKNGKEIKSTQKRVEQCKFSPVGHYYAIYQYSAGLILRRIYDESYVQLLHETDKNYIYKIKFSPNGKILAFQDTKSIKLWAVHDQKIIQIFGYEIESIGKFISSIKFSSDGQTLAFKQKDEIILWNFSQGRQFTRMEGGFKIIKIRFSPFWQHLILKDYCSSIIFNIKNLQKYNNLENNQLPLTLDSVSFSCSTPQLGFIFGCKDPKSEVIQIKIFNDMKVITEVNYDKNSKFTSFALSSDLKKIAFFNSKTVCIQKLEDGQIQEFQDFQTFNYEDIKGQKQFKFSIEGEYLIVFMQTFCSRKTDWWSFQIWEIKYQVKIYEINVNNESEWTVESFEFSNDSQSLTMPYYSQISIFNIRTKELNLLEFKECYSPKFLAFSLDGSFLACDGYDYTSNDLDRIFKIYIWKIHDKQIVQRMEGHEKSINKIIFLNEEIIEFCNKNLELVDGVFFPISSQFTLMLYKSSLLLT